jgi:hypothetical protein
VIKLISFFGDIETKLEDCIIIGTDGAAYSMHASIDTADILKDKKKLPWSKCPRECFLLPFIGFINSQAAEKASVIIPMHREGQELLLAPLLVSEDIAIPFIGFLIKPRYRKYQDSP